ncbi:MULTISPECIES: TonB-dependent receptor [unclassified Psychrosphaera]|uniref:TonB-dependent receptor n=1 Tax=unclassified Psychrosphaera TaxID=2641570 RepID=UPI0020914B77|nr:MULTISPECIES: TonB-dependent receptor [unclassified Psychrosphaera]
MKNLTIKGKVMTTHFLRKKFKKHAISLSCAALICAGQSVAADITGVLMSADQNVKFEGALVEIKSLNLKTVTQRNGAFKLSGVEDGIYTLDITYIGFNSVKQTVIVENQVAKPLVITLGESDELEEVVAYAQRSSQMDALNRQKNSKNLKSVVSSESIGQFADQNAAEALQRLPGMFIQRDQGEGRFVGIRGIDPNLNNVTINGANIPAPEAGVRSVAMDVIPSELIEGLEVSKTVTPDMDADAIGGSIEVKSLSAFDRNGRTFSVTAQARYSDLTEEVSPKLSGSFTDIIHLDKGQQLGVAAAVSWLERKFGSHNVETDGGWLDDMEIEDALTGDDVEVFGAEEIEQRYYEITRERLGVALNLDFIASATSQFYLRTLYSEFSDDEFRLRNEYKFSDGKLNSNTANSMSVVDAEMDRDTKDRYEVQTILSTVLGGEQQIDTWHLEYNVGYSVSTEEEPSRMDVTFAGEELDLSYLTSGPIPTFQAPNSGIDMSAFEMDEIEANDNKAEDSELSFKFDMSHPISFLNMNGTAQFGLKHRGREKTNDMKVSIYDGGFDDITAADFETATPSWGLGDFGPGLSRAELQQFMAQNRSVLELNENESNVASKGESYTSEETINALYAMFDMNYQNWQIIAGVRFESTQFATNGNVVRLDVNDDEDTETLIVNGWNVEKDYDHFLPSVNVRYDLSDNLLMRFAYTNTISRPNFSDSAAFQLIEVETEDGESEVIAEVGNPNLEAYEASNFDFSVEYYPGQLGVISAGLFHKNIDNFIVKQEVQDNGSWSGFDEVVQSVNGGSAKLTGLELAYTKGFDSGWLLSANTTLTDASDDLPSQSDTIANVSVAYETDKFSTRLTASYKSEAFLFEDADRRVFEDEHQQLEFSAKYYVDDNSIVYFNAVNLTDESYYLYHGTRNYNYQYEEYGRSFEIGFTYNGL